MLVPWLLVDWNFQLQVAQPEGESDEDGEGDEGQAVGDQDVDHAL
jgi:hypothetical protein